MSEVPVYLEKARENSASSIIEGEALFNQIKSHK